MKPIRKFHAVRGYDCRKVCQLGDPNCKPGAPGWHGVGSLALYFAVIIPEKRAVELELDTPMYPRSVKTEAQDRGLGIVRFHSSTPENGWDRRLPEYCDLIGGDCYSREAYHLSGQGYDALLAGGDEGVYEWLEGLLEGMGGAGESERAGE